MDPNEKEQRGPENLFGPAELSQETQAALDYLGQQAPRLIDSAAPFLPYDARREGEQKVLMTAWRKPGAAKALRADPRKLIRKLIKAAKARLSVRKRSLDRAAEKSRRLAARQPSLLEHILSPEQMLPYQAMLRVVDDAIERMPEKRRAAYRASCRTKSRSKMASRLGISLDALNKHLVRAHQDIERAVDQHLAE